MAIVEALHVLPFRLSRNFNIKVAFTASKVVLDNNREQRLHRVKDGSPTWESKMESRWNPRWSSPMPPLLQRRLALAGAGRRRQSAPEPHWGRAGLITTPHSRHVSPPLLSAHKKAKKGNVIERCLRLSWRFLLPNREREACSGDLGCPAGIPALSKRRVRLITRRGKGRAEGMRGILLSLALTVIQHKAGGVRRLFSRV